MKKILTLLLIIQSLFTWAAQKEASFDIEKQLQKRIEEIVAESIVELKQKKLKETIAYIEKQQEFLAKKDKVIEHKTLNRTLYEYKISFEIINFTDCKGSNKRLFADHKKIKKYNDLPLYVKKAKRILDSFCKVSK